MFLITASLSTTETIIGVLVLFLAALLWLYMVFLPARMAKEKGHSFWVFFFLSIFFWWITLFVVLLFLDDRTLTKKAQSPVE